jgi:hypothetical protein
MLRAKELTLAGQTTTLQITVHIQVEGEEEFVKFPGMTLELEGKDWSEFRLPRTFIFDQGSLGEKIICTLAQVCFDESNEASARPAERVGTQEHILNVALVNMTPSMNSLQNVRPP